MENHQQDRSIISDQIKVNGNLTPLTLTTEGKLQWTTEEGQQSLTVEKEVLGFIIQGSKIIIKAVTEKRDGICIFGSAGGGALVRKNFVFEPLSDESLHLWCQHLHDYINSLGRPKRLFILVNPFGGKKSALKIFFDVVKPLLEDAEVQFTVQETKYQLHAKEVVSTMDLSKYDGIVCVSGDGILVEVVNGLLEREDWNVAIKMPLGMVPAGTGNGMVKSTLDSAGEPCTTSNAVVAIIRGHKCSLDVATILQGDTKFFSVLMLAWGLVADIDIESEKYRWMGSARLDFYGLQRMLSLRQYSGRISFVPAPGFEAYGEPTRYNGEFAAHIVQSWPPEQPVFRLNNTVTRDLMLT
uniref:sphingosine kinase n=1 Tax=Salix viminalis TaxID=40686 RepID=A0A6N2KFS5_SALVM